MRLLILLSLAVLTLCASAPQPRLIMAPPVVSATTGRPLKWATSYGNGVSWPSQHLQGRLTNLSAADTLVYLFLTAEAEDSTKVDNMLVDFNPTNWSRIQDGKDGLQYSSLFDRCAFEVIPVGSDGTIIVHIDEYRNPCMRFLSIIDNNGQLLLRRAIWQEQ